MTLLLAVITTTAALAQTYTVTFDANGGSGTMQAQTFTAGEAQRLNACTFRHGASDFLGWNTKADGTGITFEDEQSISISVNLTLYAIWKPVEIVEVHHAAVMMENSGASLVEGSGFSDHAMDGLGAVNNIQDGTSTFAYMGGGGCIGSASRDIGITIKANAMITLYDINICDITSSGLAAITCEGDATIVLKGSNTMKGGPNAPAILVPAGKTLTIRGDGSLTAIGENGAAAIGGKEGEACGNIVIEGGTITATGGDYAAAIGSGKNGSCGTITIENGIMCVTAIAGKGAQPIGAGENGTCGTVSTGNLVTDETVDGTRTLHKAEEYNLWLGSTQVNAVNRTNILGDGAASYDPETQTLTLDHPATDFAIYSTGIDLTVKGYYKMSVAAEEELPKVAIQVEGGSLALNGDFVFRGSIYGIYNSGSSLSVKGTLRVYGGMTIYNSGSITLEQGFFGETRVEENGVLTRSVEGYARGNGTAEHPFEICNSSQWRKACEDVANGCATAGKHFRIDGGFYATATMGTADNPFAGTIDGQRQYFTLMANIFENKYTAYTALFPYVSGATIKNLLVKGDIMGGAGSSGIVGKAVSGTTTLENCVFDGSVTAVDSQTAANWIVGAKADGATVTTTNCFDATLNLWGDGNRAYGVTGGNGVSIAQNGTTGVTYDGAIWAPKDAVVTFTASGGNGAYAATAGTLSDPAEGVYTLTMPNDNVAILPSNAVTYTITSPGDITGGNVHTNKTEASAGAPVYISVTRSDHYLLKSLTVKDADNNEIEYDEYGVFHMPASAVTVSAEFVKKYTLENGVLTLKYGTFNNISGNDFDDDVKWHKGEVTKITADYGVRFNKSAGGLFSGFNECTEIDLSNVETSNLKSTDNMFYGCSKLEKLNMNGWDTSNVTDMSNMFDGCLVLGELDLSGFDFSSVTSTDAMFDFAGIYKLTLPAGVAITKEMRLNKGNHDSSWNYSGWQKLGDPTQTSTFGEVVIENNTYRYTQLPAQTKASTFVWKEMPDNFVLELPDGQDNRDLIALWDGMTVTVKRTGRTLYHDGEWNTLCLPFTLSNALDVSYPALLGAERKLLDVAGKYNEQGQGYFGGDEQNEADYNIQTSFDAATGTLRLFFMNGDFDAGIPMLVKWENGEDIVSPTFEKVTITNTVHDAVSTDGSVSFRGTYDNRYFPVANSSIYFMGMNNTIYYPGPTAVVGPERAYFELSDPTAHVKGYAFNFGEDDVTAIAGAQTSNLNGQWSMVNGQSVYDLQGRKINAQSTKPGIYIVNGKKVLVK